MKSLVTVFSTMIVALAVTVSLAPNVSLGDDAAEKPATEAKKGQKNKSNQLVKQALRQFKRAELTEEQIEQITELGEENRKEFRAANKAVGLTGEKRKEMEQARKAAIAEGKTKEEAKTIAEEAVELTDDQKVALEKLTEMRAGFRQKVMALLTDEQKAKMKKGKGKKKKEQKKVEEAEVEKKEKEEATVDAE